MKYTLLIICLSNIALASPPQLEKLKLTTSNWVSPDNVVKIQWNTAEEQFFLTNQNRPGFSCAIGTPHHPFSSWELFWNKKTSQLVAILKTKKTETRTIDTDKCHVEKLEMK
ncbi:MAG: hypothetical protein ACJ76H_15685 [Bacteriovoracaceae bacterium]